MQWAGKLNIYFLIFLNTVFDFAGLFLVTILVQSLHVYTGDHCEGVRSLLLQTKNPRYSSPAIATTVC